MSVAANWRSIGLALRLKHKTLDGIQAGNSSDPTVCLAAMVRELLTRNYNVKRFGEPTWQQLVAAVGHPAGGANMALAREIARRHKAEGTIYCSSALIICLLSCSPCNTGLVNTAGTDSNPADTNQSPRKGRNTNE